MVYSEGTTKENESFETKSKADFVLLRPVVEATMKSRDNIIIAADPFVPKVVIIRR